MSQIQTRKIYEHISGRLYFVMMIAEPIKKTDDQQVILSDLETNGIMTTPAKTFFDEHPDTKIPRFVQVKAVVKKA